jgi:hypothetical protein
MRNVIIHLLKERAKSMTTDEKRDLILESVMELIAISGIDSSDDAVHDAFWAVNRAICAALNIDDNSPPDVKVV